MISKKFSVFGRLPPLKKLKLDQNLNAKSTAGDLDAVKTSDLEILT